jgi:hypothetical protein
MNYIVTFNADTNLPVTATAYTDIHQQQSDFETLSTTNFTAVKFAALTDNEYYSLTRQTAEPIPVSYNNANFTDGEERVLRAMLPEQDYEFIPTGMFDVKMIHTALAADGTIMSLESTKGIVGSLIKKGLLFSEVMEESNGKMIYFSYPNFDQNKGNFFALAKRVGFDTAKFLYMKA